MWETENKYREKLRPKEMHEWERDTEREKVCYTCLWQKEKCHREICKERRESELTFEKRKERESESRQYEMTAFLPWEKDLNFVDKTS